MDPERVRAYLQAACAGLGFDIGEVWWTSTEDGSSTVAAIEPCNPSQQELQPIPAKRLRFLQLYTSKSYDDRRNELVAPPEDDDAEAVNELAKKEGKDLEKHVLSPKLVDAISNNAQVVWANTQKTEGLLGRSDMRLQTAVGMPVAADKDGNMCVVVMFSPDNLQSNDDAIEYLQSISRSATSTSIPCLLPVLSRNASFRHDVSSPSIVLPARRVAGGLQDLDGVVTRFVPLGDGTGGGSLALVSNSKSTPRITAGRAIAFAPRDCYGIPMLRSTAELGCTETDEAQTDSSSGALADQFDDASWGVWATIMNSSNSVSESESASRCFSEAASVRAQRATTTAEQGSPKTTDPSQESAFKAQSFPMASAVTVTSRPILQPDKRERLEEFVEAFLGMSVFDFADVWIPAAVCRDDDDAGEEELFHVCSVSATNDSEGLNNFKAVSSMTTVKNWSGAVGQAYGSGNPVWESTKDGIADATRVEAFELAKIETAMAIPILSSNGRSTACVLCCYSRIQTDSVPFVLRFVQQALRLLWDGLEKVDPHDSVGDLWSDVGPADLGEMAADTEMQTAFVVKRKRPRTFTEEILSMTSVRARPDESSDVSDGVASRSSVGESVITATPSLPLPGGLAPAPKLPNSLVVGQTVLASPAARVTPETTGMQNGERISSTVEAAVRSLGDVVQWSAQATPTLGSQIEVSEPSQPSALASSSPSTSNLVKACGPRLSSSGAATAASNAADLNLGEGVGTRSGSGVPGLSNSKMSIPTNAQEQPKNLIMPLPMAQAQAHAFPLQPSILPQATQLGKNPTVNHQVQMIPPSTAPQATANTNAVGTSGTLPHTPVVATANSGQHQNGVPGQATAGPVGLHSAGTPTVFLRQDGANGTPVIGGIFFSLNAAPAGSKDAAAVSPDLSVLNAFAMGAQWNANGTVPAQMAIAQTALGSGLLSLVAKNEPTAGNEQADNGSPSVVSQPVAGSVHHAQTMMCLPAVAGVDTAAASESQKICRIDGCTDVALQRRPYCPRHCGNRPCERGGCTKLAQGSTRFCIGHGGGRRCTHPGCDKGARDKFFCAAHGGGKRCSFPGGCSKSAVGGSNLCTSHGGGRRCAVDGCGKSAQSPTEYCVKHGGGKKCAQDGCAKVARGKTPYCAAHGGGKRCIFERCNRVAVGKKQLCRAHGGSSGMKVAGLQPQMSLPNSGQFVAAIPQQQMIAAANVLQPGIRF